MKVRCVCVCLSVLIPLARHQNLFYSNFPRVMTLVLRQRYGMTSTVAGYRDLQLQATEGVNSGQLGLTGLVASHPGSFPLSAGLQRRLSPSVADVPCPNVVKGWEESTCARGRSVLKLHLLCT